MTVIKRALKSNACREEERKGREMYRSGLRVGEDRLLDLAGLLGQSEDVVIRQKGVEAGR